jgi:hypothetical protein
MVALLTGGRDNPIRRAAREMRAPLVEVRNDVLRRSTQLSGDKLGSYYREHHEARHRLISTVQSELRVQSKLVGLSED